MTELPESRPGFLFALNEYSAAFKGRLDDALEGLAREKSQLLAQVPTERADHVPHSHVTAPSGEVVSNPPMAASLPFRFGVREVVEFDLKAFARACDDASEVLIDTRIDAILDYTHRITDAFGNVTSGEGRPFGWPVILEGLEKLPLDFDERGEPELPLLVSAANKRQITPYPPMTDNDQRAFDVLMARKRDEFNARRRTRQILD